MSQFVKLIGEDFSSIRAAVGNRNEQSRDAFRRNAGVSYVELDSELMKRIHKFYTREETDVMNINALKDHFTFSGGVKFQFGGEEIDDSKFAIEQSLRELMQAARDWYYMYGFVAIRNKDVALDKLVQDMHHETQEGTSFGSAALESSETLLAEAKKLIEETMPEIADEMKQALLGVPAESATAESFAGAPLILGGTPGQRRRQRQMTANSVAPSDPRLAGSNYVARSRLRKQQALEARANMRTNRTGASIQESQRTTSLKAPEAVLQTQYEAGGGGDDGSRSDDEDEIKTGVARIREEIRAELGLGATPEETRENQRRQALANKARTLEETIAGLRNLQIVDLSEGRFYLERDSATRERRVVFVSGRGAAIDRQRIVGGDSFAGSSVSSVNIDESVFVMVWPNKMPDWEGNIQTGMLEVIRLRRKLDQEDMNADEVNWRNAHPIQLMRHVAAINRQDVERMTDQEFYGGGAGTNAQRKRTQEEKAIEEYQLGMAAQVINGHRRGQLAEALARGRIGETVIDARGNATNIGFSTDDFVPLPAGIEPVNGVVPQNTADFSLLMYRFRRALTNALQMPLQILDGGISFMGKATKGGSGGAGANTSTGSQQIGEDKLIITVKSDRRIMKQLVERLWTIMYHDIDSETIAQVLSNETTSTRRTNEDNLKFMRIIARRLRNYTELADEQNLRRQLVDKVQEIAALNARLRQIRKQLLEVAAMQHRFEVIFDDISFLPADQLERAQNIGAITPYEHANAVRIGMGLPAFTEAEFESLLQKRLDEQRKELEMQGEVAQKYSNKESGGGGGSSASAPAKKRPANGATSDAAKRRRTEK